jgi:16S rRNA (cytosine967-C5)-methyltransferase
MIDGVRHRIGLRTCSHCGDGAAAAGRAARSGAAGRLHRHRRRTAARARWRLAPAGVAELAAPSDLLAAAGRWRQVARSSIGVPLTRAGDHRRRRLALTALPGFTARPRPGAPWVPHGRGALLLPQAAGTDGMFVLALQRTD